jgi:hypothetical protein
VRWSYKCDGLNPELQSNRDLAVFSYPHGDSASRKEEEELRVRAG